MNMTLDMNVVGVEMRLLNDFQHGFPLTPAPFRDIAQALHVEEQEVIARLHKMQQGGSVSRVGAVFRPNRVGVSTLAALAVPAARLDEVARLVSTHPEVNHNYEREHRYNLWFVVTATDAQRRAEVLKEIEQESGCPLLFLPMLNDYHIDLGFDLHGRHSGKKSREQHAAKPAAEFVSQAEDERLIAAIQDGLPLVPRPYAEIATQAGMSEQQVIARLGEMQAAGVIKRMGVVVRHQELGFSANAMAVWDVPDEQVDALGQCIGKYDFVTLCYRRQRQLPQWRYNLYCMVHGRDRETVRAHLQQLAAQCGMQALPHEVLFSTRRFKQCGARYVEPKAA